MNLCGVWLRTASQSVRQKAYVWSILPSLTLSALLLLAVPGRAAISVIDFSNLAQSITQVTHAVTQIQNQVQQISQMAQTLQTIGGSDYAGITAGLTDQLTTMQNTLGTLTQISQSVNNIQTEFNALFPDQATWDRFDFSTLGSTVDDWSAEIDNATVEAMTAQAIVQRAGANVAQVNSLLAQSQVADGEVRQLQLLNQNMAILSRQMNDTLQLLAANGRLEAVRAAREEKAREAARALKSGMMQNFNTGTYTTPPLTHLP